MNQVKLTNVSDEYLAQNIVDLLRVENIKAYYISNVYGEVTQVIAGHSAFGYDIYVEEEDFIEAKECLEYLE